ncbi:MAG: PLP-dependent aminotransferase family protein [Bacteroidota bacterium]
MDNFNSSLWKITEPIKQKPGKQLVEFITRKILDGGLTEDDKLPSQRDFAALNKLNVNTVKRVYNQLNAHGLIKSIPGRGTFVSYEKEVLEHINKRFTPQLPIALTGAHLTGNNNPVASQDFLSIGLDLLGPSFTPFQQLSKYLRAYQDQYNRVTQYKQILDFDALDFRASIGKYLKETRGFWLEPGYLDVIFTREQALRRLLPLLLGPGAALVNTCGQDRQLNAILAGMEVREHVLQTTAPDFIDQLETLLQNSEIHLLIVRPQCGYPEGNHLNTPTCERLLALAKEYQFYILEEDPYHEFWYGQMPYKPLCNYDHEGHVIYLGVLSQLSVYMLNTYVVCASKAFIDLLNQHLRHDFPFRDLIQEKAIAKLLNSGEMWHLVKEVRFKKGGEKGDLEYNLNALLGDYMSIHPSSSGLSLWLCFADTIDIQQMMLQLQNKDVNVPYHPVQEIPEKRCHKMRLGFGTYDRDEALDAAKILAKILKTSGHN